MLDRALDRRLELATATSAATKASLRHLYLAYHTAAHMNQPLPSFRQAGFRIFSEADEDGILLLLLAVVGVDRGRFIDIGAGDCLTASNCANLALNLGFHGLFIDADSKSIQAGQRFYASHRDTKTRPPVTSCAFVTRENVNELLLKQGFQGDIDVLSIDIDGNDYWIWEAIDAVDPRIVVIETHDEWGVDDVCAPYRPGFDWRQAAPGEVVGASPTAMRRLGADLGYRLVGANRHGFNAFFLRRELAVDHLPTIEIPDMLTTSRASEAGADTGTK